MDRSTLQRILLAVGVFFLVWMLFGKGCDKDKGPNTATYKELYERASLPDNARPGAPCTIDTPQFEAVVDPVAGGVRTYRLKGAKYIEGGQPIDVARRTSVDAAGVPLSEHVPLRATYTPLRATFRNDPASETQVAGDQVAYATEKKGDSCILTHRNPGVVEIIRTIRPSARPYELELETSIKNLSSGPRKHAFSTGLYAAQLKSMEGGGMFSRPSPNEIFEGACAFDNGKVERKDKGALRSWFVKSGAIEFVAITSGYIGQAIVPVDGNPHCAILAQDLGQNDEVSLFHAVLVYPQRELAADASATYKQVAFIGPKERHLLAAAGGGGRHLDELINLGTFTIIAKQLVRFLAFMHSIMGSWGVAIILLTITVRLALMPLTLPQIRSSISMRRLKPEIDKLNKQFENDQQAKMLATSQLYKKHGISPLAGCLPALLQMPVWFALYTALQTAIELYHEKFLFWHDLSSPDPRFVLPLVLGVTMFVQQKVTPMQMDPAQQKMMTYFMPALFTVFMLFLPAGLGVYMLTNSLLGIAQTIAVERYMVKNTPAAITVTAVASKPKDGDNKRSLS